MRTCCLVSHPGLLFESPPTANHRGLGACIELPFRQSEGAATANVLCLPSGVGRLALEGFALGGAPLVTKRRAALCPAPHPTGEGEGGQRRMS